MKFKAYFLIPIFVLFLVGVFTLGVSLQGVPSQDVKTPVTYHSSVFRQVTRADGTIEPGEYSSNVLYDTGAELLMDALFETAFQNNTRIQVIELCNSSYGGHCDTPSASGDVFNVYTDSGLEAANGTYLAIGNGNKSISNTFTATADDLTTNVTRLTDWDSNNFSGVAFTTVTLQTDDTLFINWSIWVA